MFPTIYDFHSSTKINKYPCFLQGRAHQDKPEERDPRASGRGALGRSAQRSGGAEVRAQGKRRMRSLVARSDSPLRTLAKSAWSGVGEVLCKVQLWALCYS